MGFYNHFICQWAWLSLAFLLWPCQQSFMLLLATFWLEGRSARVTKPQSPCSLRASLFPRGFWNSRARPNIWWLRTPKSPKAISSRLRLRPGISTSLLLLSLGYSKLQAQPKLKRRELIKGMNQEVWFIAGHQYNRLPHST